MCNLAKGIASMHRRTENFHQLREFASLVAPSVQRVIRAREASYRLFGWIKKNEGQHCRAVVFSVSDDLLHHYGIIRAGAFIPVTDANSVSHAYFALRHDPTFILDFCAGFIAVSRNESVNNWRRQHPELFHQKALLHKKDVIARSLQIRYPTRDIPFWDHFNSK